MDNNFSRDKKYLPAAGKNWLLPLYDPLVRLFNLDRYYCRLLKRSGLLPSEKILDIGCGTGSLAQIIKETIPEAEFTRIDPDPKALAIAVKKLNQYTKVRLEAGIATDLPYSDSSFDQVLSSFVFHHLNTIEKIEMTEEARRVLKKGGKFHAIDFDWQNIRKEFTNQSIDDLLQLAGFHSVETETEEHWLFGTVSFYSAN